MSFLSSKPLNEIFQTNEKLTKIMGKVTALKKIEAILHKTLSELLFSANNENSFSRELIQAIQVANYENSCLQLLCDNAAISTRLRYLLPELTRALREKNKLPNLVRIDLRIAQTATTTLAEKKINISPKSSKLLKDTLAKLKR